MSGRDFRGADFEHSGKRSHFDPIAEGKRYGLTPEVSEQIWAHVCEELGVPRSSVDECRAQERFRELAKRVAARGGHLGPGLGKSTLLDALAPAPSLERDVLADAVPGRTTQVLLHEQRWERRMHGTEGTPVDSEPLHRTEINAVLESIAARSAHMVVIDDAEHSVAASATATTTVVETTKSPLGTRFGGAPQDGESGARALDAARGRDAARRALAEAFRRAAPANARKPSRPSPTLQTDNVLPLSPFARPTPLDAAVGLRMSRLFGVDLTQVPVVPNSPLATDSTKAVTKDGELHFRAGAYQPGTPAGDRLIAHELAHVVQQQGRGERAGTRTELEREADHAATLASRGHAARIGLRAESTAAYSFNESEHHDDELEPVPTPESELLDEADEAAPHIAPAKHEHAHPRAAPAHEGEVPAAPHTTDAHAVAEGHKRPAPDKPAHEAGSSADQATPSAHESPSSEPSARVPAGVPGTEALRATPQASKAPASTRPASTPTGTDERHAPPEGSATVVSVRVEPHAPAQAAPVEALPPGAIAQHVKQSSAPGHGLAAPAKRPVASVVQPAGLDIADGIGAELSAPAISAASIPSITATTLTGPQPVRFASSEGAAHAGAGAAEARADAFVGASQERVSALRDYVQQTARTLEPRLATATRAIDAAKRKNQSAIRAAMARLRQQSATRVEAARTDAVQQHERTVGEILSASRIAQTRIDAQTMTALQAVALGEARCVPLLDAAYRAGDKRFRQSGETVGHEAIARGAVYRVSWLAQLDGESSIVSGPVHDNRLKARAKAADQVAETYRNELIAAANKQAEVAQQGKARDREALAACGKAHRDAILGAQRDAHAGVAHAEATAIESTDKQRDTNLQMLAAQHRSTLKQIARKEVALLKEVGKYANGHQAALRGFVHAAVLRCQSGIDEMVGHFDASMGNFRAQAAATTAPNADELEPQLQRQRGDLQQAADATETRFGNVFAGVEQQIATTEGQSVQGFDQFADAVHQTAGQIGASITHTVSQFTQHSHKGLTAIQQRHAQSVKTTADTANNASQNIAASSTTAFSGLTDNLGRGFEKSARGLETDLRDALKGLAPQIHTSADEAAKQVQPRWKKVLKVLVTIAVVVVVAVVAGPAVIGAVGAMAGALGASAAVAGGIGVVVGGAAVGAASGAVLQISNNVLDGNKWHEGVGSAMLVGAISGVFGGVGGLAAKGLASVAFRTLVTLGFDGAGSVVGNLATHQPLTFEGIAMGLAIGLGMSVGMGALGKFGGRFGKKVEGIQTRAHEAGEAFGERAATTVKGGPAATVKGASVGREPSVAPGKTAHLAEGSALAKQGRKATVEQAHEALAQLNLSAEHAVSVRNANYKLSDLVDIGEGRLAAVAIVEVDGVATVQLFYRSNSQTGWRLLPAMNEGVEVRFHRKPLYDKGEGSHTLDLPSQVQAKLSSLAEAGQVRADLHSDTVASLVNKVVPTNRGNKEYFDYRANPDYAGNQVKRVKLTDPTSGQLPEGKRPAFGKLVSQYKSTSAVAGDVDALVYNSLDGTLEYTVFKDAEDHIWIGSVSSKEAKITPLGVASEAVQLPKQNTVPLWEYHEEIPRGFDRGVTNSRRPLYGSTWEFLKEQPDIQAWYRETGTPMPSTHVARATGGARSGLAQPEGAPTMRSPPAAVAAAEPGAPGAAHPARASESTAGSEAGPARPHPPEQARPVDGAHVHDGSGDLEPAGGKLQTATEATQEAPASSSGKDNLGAHKLSSGAKQGLDPSPESIRQGTVRMEDHPDYPRVVADLEAKGYKLEFTKNAPHVEVREVLTKTGELIRTERAMVVVKGMRFIDLEHELGHVEQLERFKYPVSTHRSYEDGRDYTGPLRPGYLTTGRDAITEYHNRLVEFFRLKARGVELAILQEHADGVRDARARYWKDGVRDGRAKSNIAFERENFPDLRELVARFDTEGSKR